MLADEVSRLHRIWLRKDFQQHLEWLEIEGIRGWESQRVDFNFPIVSISGENGVGKSTIIQAAAAVYRTEKPGIKPYFASDFFPDTIWEKVRDAEIRYSVRKGDKTITRNVRKRTNRWRGNPERPYRPVVFLDLRRTQPLYAKPGYAQMLRRSRKESTATEFDDTQRKRLGNIIGKTYTSARSAKASGSPNRPVPIVEVSPGEEYSGFHQGAGEATVVDLIALEIPKYALVLIDEVETSLHPRAQRRLIRELANQSREKLCQFIVTTHSPYVMEELPPEARVHIFGSKDEKRVVFGISPEFALSKMDETRVPEVEIYVEDREARILLEEIVASYDLELLSRIAFTTSGSANVGKALGQMKSQGRFRRKTVVFLDGDQDPCEGCQILPGDNAPEKVVFHELQQDRWQEIHKLIQRSHSVLVDECDRVVSSSEHHKWIPEVADKLTIGGEELWRIMCRRWVTITNQQEANKEIIEMLRDELNKE